MTNKPVEALVIGQDSIAQAVEKELASRNIATEVTSHWKSAELDATPSWVFNLWYPEPSSTEDESRLWSYSAELIEQGMTLGVKMAEAHDSAAILNFAFLPAIYVGTTLEDSASSLRGGITGATRTLARKFGKQGLRVTGVQAGLIDIPETQQWASEAVKAVQVPTKRWASAEEVAKLLVFLAVDSTYTTGQTMIIDGGLTAGISGT